MFHELVLGDVLVAPIVSYCLFGLIASLLLRPLLRRLRLEHWFSNPAAAELGLYLLVVASITLAAYGARK